MTLWSGSLQLQSDHRDLFQTRWQKPECRPAHPPIEMWMMSHTPSAMDSIGWSPLLLPLDLPHQAKQGADVRGGLLKSSYRGNPPLVPHHLLAVSLRFDPRAARPTLMEKSCGPWIRVPLEGVPSVRTPMTKQRTGRFCFRKTRWFCV